MHVLALAGLTKLFLVGAAFVLWTEPYPSLLIGLALPALALFGAWRFSRRVVTALGRPAAAEHRRHRHIATPRVHAADYRR
jgi:hypothetical protein